VPILGIAFIGEPQPDSEATIGEIGQVRRLGRLPLLDPLNQAGLAAAFRDSFRLEDFTP
jgi:dethiobiotin synthetase